MTDSLKVPISLALVQRLQTVTELKTIEFDKVRLRADDFMSIDCPAVQMIDVAEQIEHERSRAKKTWMISLELIMKGTADQPASQIDLWNLQYKIERALWAEPNLNIPGVIHLRYKGSQTDLHLLDPYFYTRMDFDVLYYEHLVSDC